VHPSRDWTLKFCGNLSQKLRQRVSENDDTETPKVH